MEISFGNFKWIFSNKNQTTNKDDESFLKLNPRSGLSSTSLVEKISNGYSMFDGMTSIMPNPDPVLRKMGFCRDVDTYKEILADPQLYGVIENNRKPGVTRLLMYLDNPKCPKPELEFFQNYFDKLVNEGIYRNNTNSALDTPQFGRVTIGSVWDFVDGWFLPVRIEQMPYELCKFDYQGRLLISKDGANFDLPEHPAKYITLVNKGKIDNPYGEALLSKCYWNIIFKKSGLKLWGKFIEKYGMPWVKAEYKPGQLKTALNTTNLEDAANWLLGKLTQMAQDGIIVFPEGVGIDLLESRKSSNDIYENLIRICDEQNTKLQLGHSGATESTSGDKLSNDTTATEVRQNVIDSDKQFPIQLWNKIIYWIHTFNFSGAEIPRFDLYAKEEVDMSYAQRDALLVPVLQQSNKKWSHQYLESTYGFVEGDLEDVEIVEPAANTQPTTEKPVNKKSSKNQNKQQLEMFGNTKQLLFDAAANPQKDFPDQNLIDDEAQKAAGNTSPTDALVNIAVDFLNNQDSYEKAIENIAGLFPKMKTAEMQDYMEKILFAADCLGRLSAKDEMENINKE